MIFEDYLGEFDIFRVDYAPNCHLYKRLGYVGDGIHTYTDVCTNRTG